MPNLPAPALPIIPDHLQTLRRWANASTVPAALAVRAQLLLLAADGIANTQIAEQLGLSRPTVITWRHRYLREGLAGLADRHRAGRPHTVRRDRSAEILAATLRPPPHE